MHSSSRTDRAFVGENHSTAACHGADRLKRTWRGYYLYLPVTLFVSTLPLSLPRSLQPLLDSRRPAGIIKNGRCSSQLTLRDSSRSLNAARSRLDALCTVISSINGCANCAAMGSRIHVCRSRAIVGADDVPTIPAARGTAVYGSSRMNQLCFRFLLWSSSLLLVCAVNLLCRLESFRARRSCSDFSGETVPGWEGTAVINVYLALELLANFESKFLLLWEIRVRFELRWLDEGIN